VPARAGTSCRAAQYKNLLESRVLEKLYTLLDSKKIISLFQL
jgi:hypothetical protein